MKHVKIYEDFKSRSEIKAICDEYDIKYWKLNSDGTLDVYRDVYLQNKFLNKLPLKFGKVEGNFFINDNKIKSLIGCPTIVSGGFYCYGNKIKSLIGSPKVVEFDFDCSDNKLTSLEGSPEKVRSFFCNDNELTSLIGGPLIIDNYYQCFNNNITTFLGFPNFIDKSNILIFNNPISGIFDLFEDPSKIELFNDFDIIRGNDLIIDRLNDFLVTIGEDQVDPLETFEGYNNIN
jgi:hypothetical protein